jgi:ferredoxin/flavodoxin---NADP+ reductase
VVKRAYSICSSMLDSSGRLALPQRSDELEFYVTLVRQAEKHAPALTPRLFALRPGDRLFLETHAHGHYTLAGVGTDDDVIFAATGTGEAPHNAMLADLLARGHRGRIASLTCVRYQRDLAYLATHRRLEQMFPNYRYLGLTTREPWNVDSTRGDYVGKCYLQEYFATGRCEEIWGAALDPARTHVFLCGNPTMIGAPQHAHALRFYPRPTGMVEILEGRGFRLDEPHHRGNIHLEKYW